MGELGWATEWIYVLDRAITEGERETDREGMSRRSFQAFQNLNLWVLRQV